MINDYGLKSFHFVVESGEVEFEVDKESVADIEILIKGNFDIVGMPLIRTDKKIDWEVKCFTGDRFILRVVNNTKRKKRGKIIYEVRGLKVWT